MLGQLNTHQPNEDERLTDHWLPAIKTSGVDFDVRVHDLRHAHATWLLGGGSDLKSVMDRMRHAQITTTQKYLRAPARRRRQEPRRPEQDPLPTPWRRQW